MTYKTIVSVLIIPLRGLQFMLVDVVYALLFSLRVEVVPECRHVLADRNGVGIVAYKSEHKGSVLAEIVFHEFVDHHSVLVCSRVTVHNSQMLLDIAGAVSCERTPQCPGHERKAAHGGYEYHPEPEEQVDLLVE